MQLLFIVSTILLTFIHSSPITPRAGAGGPIAKPIPSTCTVTNPLPHTNCSAASTSSHKPSHSFASDHTLYEAYFDLPTSTEELWAQCSQQCYGYGEEGDCKSAVFAREVPVPEGYYGAEGGELRNACLLFDQFIETGDFEKAVEGQWVGVKAGSIHC
jgi:hypothetical protein